MPTPPAAGYAGLSMFRRGGEGAPDNLVRVNAHLDPIDWRDGGGLLPREALWSNLAEAVEARVASRSEEPIGLLTHHRVHDARYRTERLPNGDVRFHRRT